MKWLVLLPVFIIFFSGLFALGEYSLFFVEEEEKKPEKITVLAVGDIMLDRGVRYMTDKYGSSDYRFCFEKVAEYLSKADICFANLESQISDKGNKIGTVNSFRADINAMEGLKFAGIDIVSVANNHMFDYNVAAFKDSFKRLHDTNIEYVGGGLDKNEAFGLKIIEVEGVKIGFLAHCTVGAKGWTAGESSPGMAFISDNVNDVIEDIKQAKNQVDILFVSSHSGDEYELIQNKSQEEMYRSFIDAGTDVVLGHHPHVMQPVEQYESGWIAYSMGNFVFDMGFSEDTMKGMVLEVQIKGKDIESVLKKEIKMNKYFQPKIID